MVYLLCTQVSVRGSGTSSASDLQKYGWSKAEQEKLGEGVAGGDCTSSLLQPGQPWRFVTSEGFSYLHLWKTLFLLLHVRPLLLLLTFLCPSHTMPKTVLLVSLFKNQFASERSQPPHTLSRNNFTLILLHFILHKHQKVQMKSLSKEIYPMIAWVIISPTAPSKIRGVWGVLSDDFGSWAVQCPLLFYLFLVPLDISSCFNRGSINNFRRIHRASRVMHKLLTAICRG